jgi:LmbE family N-acetylglucosaminyl deacetylase
MKGLRLAEPGQHLSVLCLGAHSDDIEIGAGGTILQWMAMGVKLDVTWCVLSGVGPREAEARGSAADFLAGAERSRVEVQHFRDGFFPADSADIKAWFEALKQHIEPDVILTHYGDDAHQDHREISRLTWNTFRDHSILEYEIPKWDGDVGRPNVYVPLEEPAMARKVELLMRHFGSQRSKHWFDEETFRGLARLRAMECRAPGRYAEAFHARKLLLG